MLTCKQITELVTEYAEGRMGFFDRLRFWMHLGMCSNCKTYVRQLRAAVATLGKLPEPPLPPALKAELERRFEGWQGRRHS